MEGLPRMESESRVRNNKNSATEDQLGELHKAVTGAFRRKIELMLAEIEKNPDDAMFVLDEKAIAAAGNWVLKNEISYAAPESVEDDPLKKSLDKIRLKQKGRVISFVDEKESHG